MYKSYYIMIKTLTSWLVISVTNDNYISSIARNFLDDEPQLWVLVPVLDLLTSYTSDMRQRRFRRLDKGLLINLHKLMKWSSAKQEPLNSQCYNLSLDAALTLIS